jgi:hypothetical protein
MLQIDIVRSDGDNLELEVNGRPNNGNSQAERGWRVHWKVDPNSDVEYIEDIKIKHIGGSSDIFSSDQPAPQNANRTHWKATVNAGARDYEVYVYKIVWRKKGEHQSRIFDPIIAIKPTTMISATSILTATVAVSAAVGISYLLYGRGKNWKKNKFW